jgi:alpha-galactosidase
MGFNTWNRYGCGINEALLRKTADAMVSTGLLAAGYEYLNMDDCWASKTRAADGSIQSDSKNFPSGIKALADYAHGRGLKFGLYTAENPTTCAGRAGSYAHEKQDAKSYCDWGVDYVKVRLYICMLCQTTNKIGLDRRLITVAMGTMPGRT